MTIPIISIDTNEARKLDITIALRKLYYRPDGYYRTVKKLLDASQKAGYNFTFNEMHDWLEKQALHQIHKPRPKFISRVSFNNIRIPNECH